MFNAENAKNSLLGVSYQQREPRHEQEQQPAETPEGLKRLRRKTPSPQRSPSPQPWEDGGSYMPSVGDQWAGAVCVWADEWGGPVVWVADETSARDVRLLRDMDVSVLVRCLDGRALRNVTGIFQVSAQVRAP
jgi:hypothetical protein